MITFSVCPMPSPLRLDLYLHQLFPHVSRRRFVSLFDAKQIGVADRVAKKSDLVLGKEAIVLKDDAAIVLLQRALIPNAEMPLSVLYEDEFIFAVDKPAGISTLPQHFSETDTLANAVLSQWPFLHKVGRSPLDGGLLQRLDRETSGVVMGAKDAASFDAMWALMQGEAIEKTYVARVSGVCAEEQGIVRHDLFSKGKHSPRVSVDVNVEGVYHTAWKVLSRFDHETLLEVTIRRGFRHQIRAHLASIGHPIMGDTLYHGPAAERLFLHAARVGFCHPMTGKAITVESPHPFGMNSVIPIG